MVRGLFRILLPYDEGLPARDALARLEREIPPTPFEASTYPNRPAVRRYEKIVRFQTIPSVKAGWLVKNKGQWFVTPEGRWAFEELQDPEEFMRESVRHYKEWETKRASYLEDEDVTEEISDEEAEEAELEPWDAEGPLPESAKGERPSYPDRAGSAPRFKKVDYTLAKLIEDVQMGELALPDIQRPFVWPNTKVRDLFDSMYRGYPVGYLLFWATVVPEGHRQVGADQKQKVPHLLIVDGQQRLTSLYSVITGTPVVRENYARERMQIAFSPVTGRFEVADAAIRRDPEFVADISELWAPGVAGFRFVREFVKKLRRHREVTDEEEDQLAEIIDRVKDLRNYPFTALELSSSVSEEQVAEVFVRINSAGTQLNQADFILTLMSVFWDKGRLALEEFSRASREPVLSGASPFNYFIQPDPDQLLRVSVGLAFRRARLQHVYSILRGKDLATGQFSEERRQQQFAVLEEAQDFVLDLQNWHDFFKAVMQAGYRYGGMVSSKMNLIYSYLMFLIGKRDFGVDSYSLRGVITRWFFMVALTGRYTGSPETVMERDLARLDEVSDPDGFIAMLDRIIDETLTNDYWNIGLPNELATSSPISPSLSAFHAAQVLLDAPVLFSKLKVAELLDPSVRAKKAAVERHHLFPKGYLKQLAVTRPRETNQIANMALVEWPDNISISDTPPSEYWPRFSSRLSSSQLQEMMTAHGLFRGWESLDYEEFLQRRRKQMAAVIARGFHRLRGEEAKTTISSPEEEQEEQQAAANHRRRPTEDLIREGESLFVEFKESARWSHIHGDREKTSEKEVIRALAGLLNGRGGTLLIGVNDQGEVLGLRKDFKSLQKRPDKDGFENWLTGVLRDRLGGAALAHLTTTFEVIHGREICRIDADPAPDPIFVEDQHFFLRLGNTTQALNMREMREYARSRWRTS